MVNLIDYVNKNVIIALTDGTYAKGKLYKSKASGYYYCMNGNSMYKNLMFCQEHTNNILEIKEK